MWLEVSELFRLDESCLGLLAMVTFSSIILVS